MPAFLLVSPAPLSGKTTVAAGLAQKLRAEGKSVHLTRFGDDENASLDSALFARLSGSTDRALADIALLEAPAGDVAAHPAQAGDARVIVVADAATPVDDITACSQGFRDHLQGVILNRVPSRRAASIRSQLEARSLGVLGTVPEDRLLATPSLGEVARALNAETLFFDGKGVEPLDRTLIASISADPVQEYFAHNQANTVIVRSDKPDLQLGALNAGASCLIVTGGLPILHYVLERAEEDEVPIIRTNMETIPAVQAIEDLFAVTPFSGARAKMQRLHELLADIDPSRLLAT